MARIPEADIERLKQEVSVQRLVEALGRRRCCVRPAGACEGGYNSGAWAIGGVRRR